jgi:hypothetical protein
MKLTLHPLTPARWDDFEAVFRSPGCSVARGCWCSDSNRREMKALVDGGEVTGLLGYRDGEPVGWISLGPRSRYRKLERSPVMKPVDDKADAGFEVVARRKPTRPIMRKALK